MNPLKVQNEAAKFIAALDQVFDGAFAQATKVGGKPVENLFFAGEHTNSFYVWEGFMEGAAMSSQT